MLPDQLLTSVINAYFTTEKIHAKNLQPADDKYETLLFSTYRFLSLHLQRVSRYTDIVEAPASNLMVGELIRDADDQLESMSLSLFHALSERMTMSVNTGETDIIIEAMATDAKPTLTHDAEEVMNTLDFFQFIHDNICVYHSDPLLLVNKYLCHLLDYKSVLRDEIHRLNLAMARNLSLLFRRHGSVNKTSFLFPSSMPDIAVETCVALQATDISNGGGSVSLVHVDRHSASREPSCLWQMMMMLPFDRYGDQHRRTDGEGISSMFFVRHADGHPDRQSQDTLHDYVSLATLIPFLVRVANTERPVNGHVELLASAISGEVKFSICFPCDTVPAGSTKELWQMEYLVSRLAYVLAYVKITWNDERSKVMRPQMDYLVDCLSSRASGGEAPIERSPLDTDSSEVNLTFRFSRYFIDNVFEKRFKLHTFSNAVHLAVQVESTEAICLLPERMNTHADANTITDSMIRLIAERGIGEEASGNDDYPVEHLPMLFLMGRKSMKHCLPITLSHSG